MKPERDSTAVLWLAPRLGEFHRTNPQISVRLISAIWADSTSDSDVDVDLRLGPPGWFSRRAHLLAEEQVLPVAAPPLAGTLHDVAAILSGNLIHIYGYQDHWLRLSNRLNLPLPDNATPLFVDTSLAAIELAASGAGVAMIMERYAALALAQGRLATVTDLKIPMSQGHYLMPATEPGAFSTEVSLVRDWVVQLFA